MEIPQLQEQETFLRSSASSIFIADNVNLLLFLKLQAQLFLLDAGINHSVWEGKVVINTFFLVETSFP